MRDCIPRSRTHPWAPVADADAMLAAGVNLGALYYHFDGRVWGCERGDGKYHPGQMAAPLRNAKHLIDTLVAIVRFTSLRREDRDRRCPLSNLAQYMTPSDQGFRKRIARVLKN